MQITPLLSIVVATHNRPGTLIRTLESIRRNVRQSREVLVISDQMDLSQHTGVTSLLGEGDSFLFCPRLRGPAETRNLGISLAKGEFIILFDDDDEFPDFDSYYKSFLEDAISRRNVVTFSNAIIREEDRANINRDTKAEYLLSLKNRVINDIYIKNFILTPACVIPAFIAKQCSQDKYLRSLEDWDFLLNLMSKCAFVFSDTVGAVVYKDFVNTGVRRSTSPEAGGTDILLDYLYIYRRWPAPTRELKLARAALLAENGLNIAAETL